MMRGFEVEFNDRADNAEKRLIALLAVLFAFRHAYGMWKRRQQFIKQ